MGDEGGHKVLTFEKVSPIPMYSLFHLGTKKIEDAHCLDIGGSQLRMLLRCRNVMRL